MSLTHLQFANDIILFYLAKDRILKNYKKILYCFGLMSGLSINFEKSAIIPLNCLKHKVHKLSKRLSYADANLPIKNLGIQLGENPRKVFTWRPIVDKIDKKLSRWRASLLSKV